MVSDSLFRENMSSLRDKAYFALMANEFMIEDVSLGEKIRINTNIFNVFWDAVTEVLQRDRANNNIAKMYEYYDSFTPDLWIEMIERWASANITDFIQDIDNDEIFSIKTPKENENILDELKMQITNALFKDSQNRASLVLDFVQKKNDELTASLGNEAAELLREIFDGLKKDESLRLEGPKKASPTPEASTKTDEELIDELDFLDDDISDTLSLEDLEEELNLDDLKLD